jgi:hypothetical protein
MMLTNYSIHDEFYDEYYILSDYEEPDKMSYNVNRGLMLSSYQNRRNIPILSSCRYRHCDFLSIYGIDDCVGDHILSGNIIDSLTYHAH